MEEKVKHKGYKYRIYPNKEQEELINKTFGCVRFIYNKMLEDRKKHMKNIKKIKKNQKGKNTLHQQNIKKNIHGLKK